MSVSRIRAVLLVACVAVVAAPAGADEPPRSFSYQGVITNTDGTPISDGLHDLAIRFYVNSDGTNQVYTENVTVNFSGGRFDAEVGTLGLDLPFDQKYWITTEVDGGGEMLPPSPLTSVPYAIRAKMVEDGAITGAAIGDGAAVRSLNGLTDDVTLVGNGGIAVTEVGNSIVIDGAGGTGGDSDWLISGDDLIQIPPGDVGMGTSAPLADLHIRDENFATSMIVEDATPGTSFHTSSLSLHTPTARARLEFFRSSTSTPVFNIGAITSGGMPEMDIRLRGDEITLNGQQVRVEVAGTDRAAFLGDDTEFYDGAGTPLVSVQTTDHGRIALNRGTGGGIGLSLDALQGTGADIRGFDNTGRSGFWLATSNFSSNGVWFDTTTNTPTVTLASRFTGSTGSAGGAAFLSRSDGGTSVEILAQENGSPTQGGQIRLFNDTGGETVEIDGDYGSTNGGGIRLYDATGDATVHILADVSGQGRIITDVLEITGGADLSEQFDVRGGKIIPGMVVSIDADNPGGLTLATTAYDRRVAGVVSGAGGVRPGMLMGQSGSVADGSHPVALTGRVYAWADAAFGAITPGDLLTTSSTAGHARRVDDAARAGGATLGKAMTTLEHGRGLVLVLVGLQ